MKTSSFDKLNEGLRAYRISHVIFTAFEIGVFSQLAKNSLSCLALSKLLKVSRRGLKPLLDSLVALQILEFDKPKYYLSLQLIEYLSPSSNQYIGNLIAHEIHLSQRWKNLSQSVKTGNPADDKSKPPDKTSVMRFARAMSTIGQRSAELVTGAVSFRPNEHVLDLGGGPGQYQKSLCEKHENINVTLFDQDETIKIAREEHKNHPAADRMHYISGDFFIDGIKGKYDTILVSNVVHIYGPEEIADLFSRCHNRLNKNGRILIKDFILTRKTEQLPFTHLFALHMLLSTETGRCYSYREIKELLSKSGFRIGNKHQLTETSLLIEGIKK